MFAPGGTIGNSLLLLTNGPFSILFIFSSTVFPIYAFHPGALVACLITGSAGASGIFLSLFFAYAWMWPEQQVLLFFILPIKMKWMGIAAAAMWVLEFLTGNFASRVSLLFGIAGFLAFFGGEMFTTAKDAIVSYKRRKDWEKKINRK